MQLDDSFEFDKFDTKFGPVERIRIKGHRIAIDNVIERFHNGMAPEEIQREAYPTLTLAEIRATVAYYLANKPDVDAYIQRREKIADAYYQEYKEKGPFFLRDEALAERKDQQKGNGDASP
jgi:uncharacterized protein (DUF433 family)